MLTLSALGRRPHMCARAATTLILAALIGTAAPGEHAAASAPPMPTPGIAAQRTPKPPPPEVTARWEALIGTWIADNSLHKSDLDPMDAYGIQWSWGLNRRSLVGRLYGLRNGKEVGTFWEFREIWHPGEHRLVAMQFGQDGTYGVGPNAIGPDGSTELLQTFYHPEEGTTNRIGHRARLEGDVHTTTSYIVDEKGVWKERRTYVWRRQRDAGSASSREATSALEHFSGRRPAHAIAGTRPPSVRGSG